MHIMTTKPRFVPVCRKDPLHSPQLMHKVLGGGGMSYCQMMWESPQVLLLQPDLVDTTSPFSSFPHHPAQKIQKQR